MPAAARYSAGAAAGTATTAAVIAAASAATAAAAAAPNAAERSVDIDRPARVEGNAARLPVNGIRLRVAAVAAEPAGALEAPANDEVYIDAGGETADVERRRATLSEPITTLELI